MWFVRRDKLHARYIIYHLRHATKRTSCSRFRLDTDFLLTTMLESEYVHHGRTLKAVVEGHPDEIFEGSRGASKKA